MEIKDFYESYKKVIDLQEKDKEKLTGIINDQSMVHNELELLNAKKKNIAVAEGQINRSLRYVFFSKERLQIHAKNEKYCLYSYGKSVKPENVSVGERNIIALCYFFTEIISNHGIEDGYSQEMIIVIDDPVSSFDFENKVGIMSLLKYKLNKIMTNNKNSQIIVLTHDMQCMFDLQKIFQEICKEGDGVSFSGRELRNKRLDGFAFRSRHEYTELIKEMYNYASGEYEDKEYVIGNVMRRVLEAFSTFLYRKSIDEVSCDKKILAELEDNEYIEYFDNLMYRLVLHGESHMEERVKALEDIDYLEFISEDAKKRTAQEILCFMYLLNKHHILAHLQNQKDVENNLKKWCKKIKDFQKAK
ncbi:AAA family ATPase [Anaerovibrio lipolyticus]|uniref:AAA family ATPase n=1 Tax=Anaerovibrio lipolyticus TaxID=82374 RepID=UPI0026F004EE|nr:AAA family ATPase [Anaerovibrio lipolyticus]